MVKILAVLIGRLVAFVSRSLKLGAGATWPGEIALRLDPHILQEIAPRNVVLLAGTNGKTTTSLMVAKILENAGHRVVCNASGANLLNGVVSAMITSPSASTSAMSSVPNGSGHAWGVFEVDENTLPQVIRHIGPIGRIRIVVLLNLFRDQLDRYGEVDVIAEKWRQSLAGLPGTTAVVLNSDDPLIAYIGRNLGAKKLYFGLENKALFRKEPEHAMDSQFCPNCGKRLVYKGVFFSHLGHWQCSRCGEKRPEPSTSSAKYPLPGIYNRYNTLAAGAVADVLGVRPDLTGFHPAFGRQEQFNINGRKVQIFLSKNPAGFNESLRTVIELRAKNILLALNDRIPDGRDVSWIWDVDFESLANYGESVVCSGDRAYDLGLRLKYADVKNMRIEANLKKAVECATFVLPTYSAMLEIRKILTGRKIL